MYRSAEDRMSRRALLGALLAVLAPLSALDGATANAVQPSDWDAALPALELRQVDLKAPSLEKAWQQLSTAYLVRSILYVEPSARTVAPFQFRCDRCRVRDIFAALVRAYPDFTWTADRATGLLWIHPKARPMSGILNERLRLVRPACAVPFQTGVLLPLAHLPGERITVARAGTAMTNTLDVATDLPAGEYRLRDLLAAACKTHPTKTFYLRSAGGRNEVTAVHLGTDLKRPPAGALLLVAAPLRLPFRCHAVAGRVGGAARLYLGRPPRGCPRILGGSRLADRSRRARPRRAADEAGGGAGGLGRSRGGKRRRPRPAGNPSRERRPAQGAPRRRRPRRRALSPGLGRAHPREPGRRGASLAEGLENRISRWGSSPRSSTICSASPIPLSRRAASSPPARGAGRARWPRPGSQGRRTSGPPAASAIRRS